MLTLLIHYIKTPREKIEFDKQHFHIFVYTHKHYKFIRSINKIN